jgi:hypothetical protein
MRRLRSSLHPHFRGGAPLSATLCLCVTVLLGSGGASLSHVSLRLLGWICFLGMELLTSATRAQTQCIRFGTWAGRWRSPFTILDLGFTLAHFYMLWSLSRRWCFPSLLPLHSCCENGITRRFRQQPPRRAVDRFMNSNIIVADDVLLRRLCLSGSVRRDLWSEQPSF